jgi:hypothetical protein
MHIKDLCRIYKNYERLTNVCRQIEYDIKHGVTNDELNSTVQEIRNDSSFFSLRKVDGSMERLDDISFRT